MGLAEPTKPIVVMLSFQIVIFSVVAFSSGRRLLVKKTHPITRGTKNKEGRNQLIITLVNHDHCNLNSIRRDISILPFTLKSTTTLPETQIMKLTSTAAKMIQKRATTGSVSSVFYLQQAGMKESSSKMVENVFLVTVGLPLATMGVAGLWRCVQTGKI